MPARTPVDGHSHSFSKLAAHISKPLTIGSKTHDTPLSSLSLRLNHPYWLLHHGNCEHFLVVDQIRHVVSFSNASRLVELFFRLAYCTQTILPLGIHLLQGSPLHYLETVAYVRKFQLYIQ